MFKAVEEVVRIFNTVSWRSPRDGNIYLIQFIVLEYILPKVTIHRLPILEISSFAVKTELMMLMLSKFLIRREYEDVLKVWQVA